MSEQYFEDPTAIYRWLRDEAPVYRSDRYGFWALSRFADVVRASRDWHTFSSAAGSSLENLLADADSKVILPGWILNMDPPKHDRLRALVSRSFTPAGADKLEPLVREVITDFADRLTGEEQFDLVEDFAALFPCEVISTILGVPKADRQQIRMWTDILLHREIGDHHSTDDGRAAFRHLIEYFAGLVAEKRRRSDDDMISQLCEATIDDGSGPTQLDDREVAGFAVLLGSAGSETVTKLVANAAVLFDRHPGEWQRVVEDRGLIPGAVDEVNRYLPPSQYQGRKTTAAVTVEGVEIPAGSAVLLLTGAATRDPRAFVDPDRFVVDRETAAAISFGHGIHFCLGAHLARLESRIAVEILAERWSAFSVDAAGLRRVHMSNVAGYSRVPIHVEPTQAAGRVELRS